MQSWLSTVIVAPLGVLEKQSECFTYVWASRACSFVLSLPLSVSSLSIYLRWPCRRRTWPWRSYIWTRAVGKWKGGRQRAEMQHFKRSSGRGGEMFTSATFFSRKPAEPRADLCEESAPWKNKEHGRKEKREKEEEEEQCVTTCRREVKHSTVRNTSSRKRTKKPPQKINNKAVRIMAVTGSASLGYISHWPPTSKACGWRARGPPPGAPSACLVPRPCAAPGLTPGSNAPLRRPRVAGRPVEVCLWSWGQVFISKRGRWGEEGKRRVGKISRNKQERDRKKRESQPRLPIVWRDTDRRERTFSRCKERRREVVCFEAVCPSSSPTCPFLSSCPPSTVPGHLHRCFPFLSCLAALSATSLSSGLPVT